VIGTLQNGFCWLRLRKCRHSFAAQISLSLLCSCSIHRQSRNPPILPLSLTLTCFPSPSSSSLPHPTLSHMMSLLLPLSVTLPLSLPLLNTSTFTPESKNEDLHAGYLQLPAGCTVLITESGVAEGKLIEKGVMPFTFLDSMLCPMRRRG